MTVESGVEVVADSEIMGLLDFHPVFRCGYSAHASQHAGDEPAVVFMSVRCPGCGRDASFMMCGPGLARYVSGGIWCRRGCWEVFHGADWVVRTVPIGAES